MTIERLIAAFERGGSLLVEGIAGLSEEHFKTRTGPGSWSIAELTIHLLDSDLVGADRMKRVIAEENPTLLAYDQDSWLTRLNYQELPSLEAAQLFLNQRRWFSKILRNRPESDFSKTGMHTENGRVTLTELVRTYVGHVDHHLRFLYGKRGNLGVSIYPRYSDSRD